MSKREFLLNWEGSCAEHWSEAEGSSLKKTEWKNLHNGGIVVHPKKGCRKSKLFAVDEEGNLWSLIIDDQRLDRLKKDLQIVGYSLPGDFWSVLLKIYLDILIGMFTCLFRVEVFL